MDTILQHPRLVIVSAKAEFLLLAGEHRVFHHPKASVRGHVLLHLERFLQALSPQLILLFVVTFGGHLCLHEITVPVIPNPRTPA